MWEEGTGGNHFLRAWAQTTFSSSSNPATLGFHSSVSILFHQVCISIETKFRKLSSEADDQNDEYHNTAKLYCMSIIAEKRRKGKGKEEKERYKHLNAEFQRIARRDKKAFLVINAKK